jgi:AraC-like DNA-binding protein/ligand-binding sensor protein
MHAAEISKALIDDEVVKNFDQLLYQTSGLRLILLLPGENSALEIGHPAEGEVMPGFCQMVRATKEGERRCSTCRSLVAFAAANRGFVEHTCHGGVYVMAVPAIVPGKDPTETPIVSTCAFRMTRDGLTWEKVQGELKEIPLNRRELKKEYENMPRLNSQQRERARQILDLAAWSVGQKYLLLTQEEGTAGLQPSRPSVEKIQSQFHTALSLVGKGELDKGKQPSGKTLVEMVAGVVAREPALPHSVSMIADAARMTPNHFSTLFRQHMGQPFMEFLIEKRIELAKKHLANLTLTIHEAATRSGFSDANYFARVFKQRTHMTPREWRDTL